MPSIYDTPCILCMYSIEYHIEYHIGCPIEYLKEYLIEYLIDKDLSRENQEGPEV